LHEFIHIHQSSKLQLSAVHLSNGKLLDSSPFCTDDFLNIKSETAMELLMTTRQMTNNPIPVIGIESTPSSNEDDLCCQIALRAYYKAEARGYEPGHEMQDWLDAEAEVMSETKAEKDK
jgi:hypothetical protein